ncbi:aromatic-ring-hydroxylating dioxygenase subunit beta [Hydrogenophaga laconesensis]|uniref:3-phenylpropionate/cinnamic acid dioxygenase small subunit n=1 Tax=Hydrogenophaga laconesensis TaxID=1805971 RepID=A0ABU1V9B4_9BURK|nr:aromatic-ring-hydroxylating dioxygenase subunit beta [Hydrogenophaga laconesensis]MDR7094045.1 3-phenylpropionate/cinnamic acid dioxygenase small subunit [Hydrogenophaga laconesensis]
MNASLTTELNALAKRPTRPADHAAIVELLTLCADGLDDQRFDEWPDHFTDDANYRVTTAENLQKGYPVGLIDCIGKPMMVDRLFGLKSANVFEPHAYRHILSHPLVRQTGDATWRVKTSFLLARTMAARDARLFLCGHYDDVVVRTDEGMRFASRQVVLDASLIDLLIVIPI